MYSFEFDKAAYLSEANKNMSEKTLSINELKEASFSMKINKSTGYNKISFWRVTQTRYVFII